MLQMTLKRRWQTLLGLKKKMKICKQQRAGLELITHNEINLLEELDQFCQIKIKPKFIY